MLTIVGAMMMGVLSTIVPQRLYYQVNQPFPIDIPPGQNRELVLLSPTNEQINRVAVPAETNSTNLAELLPDLWDLRTVHYLQTMIDGQPVGPSLVLEPLVTGSRPVIEYAQSGGRRFPVVKSWSKPARNQVVMSGFRAYPEYEILFHTTEGDITIFLRPDEAPNTAWNMIDLVNHGFYTNIPFHRVVALDGAGNPFVIQAGDPSGTGGGGCNQNIDLEPSTIPPDLGIISMAREGNDINTNSSQFFICLSRAGTARLDVQYTSFGHTVGGIDVVQKLAAVEVNNPQENRPVDMPYITTAELIEAPPRTPGQPPAWRAGSVSDEKNEPRP